MMDLWLMVVLMVVELLSVVVVAVWALKDIGCIVIAATAENDIIAANIYAISVLFI